MDMGHTQIFDVVQTGGNTFRIDSVRFCQSKKFSFVGDAGVFIHAQIPDMKFINNSISDIKIGMRIGVRLPVFRIRRIQVDYHSTVPVNTGGSGIGITGFHSFTVDCY